MSGRDRVFWGATGVFCLIMTVGGVGNLVASEFQVKTYESLGYPLYLLNILGAAKLLGVVAILAPGLARLKEWAYAGFTFDMVGAFASHAFAGSALMPTLMPLIVLSVALTSYALRPGSRRLAGDVGDDRQGVPPATAPAV